MRRDGWTYVDEAMKLADSSLPRHGPLNGMFVRSDILWDIRMAEEMARAAHTVFGRFMRWWKGSRTFGNPATTFRNLFTNVFILAPMADINMLDPRNMVHYSQALKDFALGMRSAKFKEALKAGVFDGTFARTELGVNSVGKALGGFVGHVKGQAGATGHTLIEATRRGLDGRIFDKLSSAGKQLLWNNPGIFYGALDDFFRYAAWLKKRSQGWDNARASKFARDYLGNYGDTSGLLDIVKGSFGGSRYGGYLTAAVNVPFAAFPMKVSPVYKRYLEKNPYRAQMHLNLSEYYTGLSYAESHGIQVKEINDNGVIVDTEEPDWKEANRQIQAFRQQMPWYDRLRYVPLDQMGAVKRGLEALGIPAHERDADGKLASMRMFNVGYYSVFDWMYADSMIHDVEIKGDDISLSERLFALTDVSRLIGTGPVADTISLLSTGRDPFTGRKVDSQWTSGYWEQMGKHVLSNILPPLPPWAWYTGTSRATTIIPENLYPTPTYRQLKALDDHGISARIDKGVATIASLFFGAKTRNVMIPELVGNALNSVASADRDMDRRIIGDEGFRKIYVDGYRGTQDEVVIGRVDKEELEKLRVDIIDRYVQWTSTDVGKEEYESLRDVLTYYRRERALGAARQLKKFYEDLSDLPVDVGKISSQEGQGLSGKVGDKRKKPLLVDEFPSKKAERIRREDIVRNRGSIHEPHVLTETFYKQYGGINPDLETLTQFKVIGELVDFSSVIDELEDSSTPWQRVWDIYRMLYGSVDHKTTASKTQESRGQNVDKWLQSELGSSTYDTTGQFGLVKRLIDIQRDWTKWVKGAKRQALEEKK
jgi:hypothetical protein